MNFKITSAGNNSTIGELFFSMPAPETMEKVAKDIAYVCRRRVGQLYGGMQFAVARLETELAMMLKTNTAFHFALLEQIKRLSEEYGYPIEIRGSVNGSIISYLLGLSLINPMPPHYRCETPKCCHWEAVNDRRIGIDLPDKCCPCCGKKMVKDGFDLPINFVWGSLRDPKAPGFQINIAKTIRPFIHSRLDLLYGQADSDKSVYKAITMPDSGACERIGKLIQSTGKRPPRLDELDNEVYMRVWNDLIDGYIEEREKDLAQGYATKEEYEQTISFARELKCVNSCDFYTLIRLMGYRYGTFKEAKTIDRLYDSDFFLLRDEFFRALVACGIPNDIAADFTVSGVWSRKEKRKKYEDLLESYRAPRWLKERFSGVANLWSAAACVGHLQLLCTLAWFQIHAPQAWEATKREKKDENPEK